jgi:hypothetical protein
MALSRIITLLDEGEHAWVVSSPRSMTDSNVDGSIMSVVVIVAWSSGVLILRYQHTAG